ncbi:MAG TPA: DUF2807 domain-containing protein, partial [Chitinophagaceae bacterium]
MKIFLTAFVLMVACISCDNPFNKTVRGNGNISTSERSLSSFKNIRCAGSYDVQLTQGNTSSIKMETDENIQSYIVTDVNGDELNIHTQQD